MLIYQPIHLYYSKVAHMGEIGPKQGEDFYSQATEPQLKSGELLKKVRYVESHEGGGVEVDADILKEAGHVSEEAVMEKRRAKQRVAETKARADIQLREDLSIGKAREAVGDAARFDDRIYVSRLKTMVINHELGNASVYGGKEADDIERLRDIFRKSEKGKLMGTRSELTAASSIFGSDEYKGAREQRRTGVQPVEQVQSKGLLGKIKGIFGK